MKSTIIFSVHFKSLLLQQESTTLTLLSLVNSALPKIYSPKACGWEWEVSAPTITNPLPSIPQGKASPRVALLLPSPGEGTAEGGVFIL